MSLTTRRLLAVACSLVSTIVACASGDGGTAPEGGAASVTIGGIPPENAVLVGQATPLTATVRDAVGGTISRAVAWTSTDASIAGVNGTGAVTGVTPGIVGVIARVGTVADTVPLAVRAPVTVTAGASGSSSVLGNTVTLLSAPGTVASTVTLAVGPALLVPEDDRIVPDAAIAIGPAGTLFGAPLTIEWRIPEQFVPPAVRGQVRIYRVSGTLVPLANGRVDLARGVVIGETDRTGTFVLVVPGVVTQVAITDGDLQRGNIGETIAGHAVTLRDVRGRPVSGTSVVFTVVSGGGAIEGDSVAVTNGDGVAVLPGRWRLGAAKGANQLRASVPGTNLVAVFTATGVAPVSAIRISVQPDSVASGEAFGTPIAVFLVDDFGDPVPDASATLTARLVSGPGELRGETTAQASAGGGIFMLLRIAGGGAHRLEISAPGLRPDTTDIITVTQTLASIAFLTPPAGAQSTLPFTTQPVVELRDGAGLRLTAPATVIASLVEPGAWLIGTRAVEAVNGVATFTDLGIEGDGTYRVRFQSGFVDIISNDLTLTPPPPGIRLNVSPSPQRDQNQNSFFAVPLQFDLARRNGDDLRTVSVTVTWDPARFALDPRVTAGAWRDADGADATVTVDDSQAASGRLVVTGETPGATTSSFTLASLSFQTLPAPQTVESAIGATVTTATNAAGQPVTVTVRPLVVTVNVF